VQDLASTNYKGMPESAIAKDHPAVVGTPRALGISVTSMVNDIYLNSSLSSDDINLLMMARSSKGLPGEINENQLQS